MKAKKSAFQRICLPGCPVQSLYLSAQETTGILLIGIILKKTNR